MFKCEFSGDISDPAVYRTVRETDRPSGSSETDPQYRMAERAYRQLVTPAEKPVKLVIATRARVYGENALDSDGYPVEPTHGTEIVKEITIRRRHLETARKHYGPV